MQESREKEAVRTAPGGRTQLTCLSLAAMSPTEVTEKLGLLRMKERSWYCHPSNAIAGDGLFEGASSRSLSSFASLLTPQFNHRTELALSKPQDEIVASRRPSSLPSPLFAPSHDSNIPQLRFSSPLFLLCG